MAAIAKVAKCSTSQYYCEKCDYLTSKKYNYDKHKLTSKHLQSINDNNFYSKSSKSSKPIFICLNCSKEYKDNSGLWRHNKKCNASETPIIISNEPTDKELIMLLIKDNSELKNMMMEVIKNGTHNTNTNSLNKTFNLQFFLNETCKNAMNITDFVESIQLKLSDLEKVGELGYVEGISNIIINKLKGLDVTERPIHCTDKKREVLYVKDEDLWQKDDQQNKKVRNAIKKITDKNMKLIPQFQTMHPDCGKSTSTVGDKYNNIVVEAMGGRGDNYSEKENKIITNISKQVILDKEP
jgi:hypothetical protein